jgi:gliding motility-associatede transport system auxiliary component
MSGRGRVDVMRWAVGAAMLAAFVLASVLLSRHDFQHDFTRGQRRSLAPQSRRILASLDRPLRLTAFYADIPEDQVLLRDLVDRFRRETPYITLRFVDLDRRPEMAEEYRVSLNRTVIIEDGDLRIRTVAPGEAELIGAILRASSGRPSRVYFIEGHGEASIEDESRAGIRDAARLLAQQNFELRILQTKVISAVPPDADVVVLPSPESPLTAAEMAQLTRYLLGGGRLMAMLEPMGSASADSLVARFGIVPDSGFIVDASDERQNLLGEGNFRFALALGGRAGHRITDGFNMPVAFPIARGLHIEQPPPPGVDAYRLLQTGDSSWSEQDLSILAEGTPLFLDGEDVAGPVGLAFASEVRLREFQLDPEERETMTSLSFRMSGNVDHRDSTLIDSLHIGDDALPLSPSERARMVVIGDVDFINNANLRVQGNSEFFLASMLWLAEQESRIALAAPTDLSDPIVLTQRQRLWIRLLALLVLPAAMFLAAAAVTWRRRRWL